MDRFQEIKRAHEAVGHKVGQSSKVYEAMGWLIAEVERQRAEKFRQDKIEDIARALDSCICEFGADSPSSCGELFQILSDLLDANPRPDDDQCRDS